MARSRAGDEFAFGRARPRWKRPASPDSLAAQVLPKPGAQVQPDLGDPAPAEPAGVGPEETTSQRGHGPAGAGGAASHTRAAPGASGERSSQEWAARRVRDALSQ